MSTACLVVGAGSGVRLEAGRPKAFVPLAGFPLLVHAVAGVVASGVVDVVVAVVPRGMEGEARAALPRGCVVVAGGATRQESVRAGLSVLRPEVDVVLVHDAARCLTPATLTVSVVKAVRGGCAVVVPALPVSDTVRQVDTPAAPGRVLDRSLLRLVQTPQGFERGVLERAHAVAAAGALTATDDATLAEALGETVHLVPGSSAAFKVTGPLDLALAEAMFAVGAHA